MSNREITTKPISPRCFAFPSIYTYHKKYSCILHFTKRVCSNNKKIFAQEFCHSISSQKMSVYLRQKVKNVNVWNEEVRFMMRINPKRSILFASDLIYADDTIRKHNYLFCSKLEYRLTYTCTWVNLCILLKSNWW